MVLGKRIISKSGFTLMEVIVVLGVISILAAVSILNIFDSLPGYRLRSAVRDIVSSLQEVKMMAVKENIDTYIYFDVANDEYKAWVDDGVANPDNGSYDADENYFKEVTLTNGIELYQNTSFTGNIFGFNSRGLPATAGGNVFIKNSRSGYIRIRVSIAGNIKIQRSSDGITWN